MRGSSPLETVFVARTARWSATDVATRTRDIVLSTLLIILLTPMFLFLAAAVGVSSGGPIFFRQTRVGRGQRQFLMLKFRTMTVDCDEQAHRSLVTQMFGQEAETHADELAANDMRKLVDDDRVTRVGRVLRRFSMDEMPQLLNVLVGHMSLVGPRPTLPWEVELFEPRHLARFNVKPGMTGLWQVSGRSKLTMPQALEIDIDYVKRRSFWLDMSILVRTLPVVLSGRGAS